MERAYVYDIDDVLVKRDRIARWSGAINGIVNGFRIPDCTKEEIAALGLFHDQDSDAKIVTLTENLSFTAHARRKVYPGAIARFEEHSIESDHVYVATGRSNKLDWVEMTENVFRTAGIRHVIKQIYYTPDGIQTAMSKADVIMKLLEHYPQVEFHEDDPRTALYIAKLFPNVDVQYHWYKSTGLMLPTAQFSEQTNLHIRLPFG